MQGVLRGIGTIIVSTAILISACALAGIQAFTTPSIFSLIGLAVGLTVVATIVHYAIALVTLLVMKYKQPGLALPTLAGVIAGTIAIWLVGLAAPNMVHFGSFWSGLPFSAVNVALVWAITILFVPNAAYKGRPFWPQWKDSTPWPGS